MRTTRRRFVHLSLGAFSMWVEADHASAGPLRRDFPAPGQAVPFVPNEPNVVSRLSASEIMQQPARRDQFYNAFAGFVNSADAKIGWGQWVNWHAVNCTTAPDVHESGRFYPWHRAMLYFVERILRKNFSQDTRGVVKDDLRLIYWNWEADQNLPDIYNHSDLYPALFAGDFTGLAAADVSVQGYLFPDPAQFGGTINGSLGRTPDTTGGPHAAVHKGFSGYMHSLATAANAPIFYAHHANIDRFWSSWHSICNQSLSFNGTLGFFYDENGTWSSVNFDLLSDEAAWGYNYSSLMGPGLSCLASDAIPFTGTKSPFTADVHDLPRIHGLWGHPSYLIIRGLRLGKSQQGHDQLGVFNTPPEVGARPEGQPGYLGTVPTLAGGHGEHGNHQGMTASINVTEHLTGLVTEKGKLSLFIAPLSHARRVTEPVKRLEAREVTLSGLDLSAQAH
jgi:hypothetical protein